MGADIDLNNQEVIDELNRWGKWFVHTTDVDGFRIDAVKHMKFTFYRDWLDMLRREEKEELFSVGEYWNGDLEALKNYVDTTEGALSLFDVPLHFRFFDAASSNGAFDMRTIFDGTLTKDNPLKSVTFVDNHDSQPGQALESWIPQWFKPLAYALILLRQDGYPCVFYGDYYGIEHDNAPSMRDKLVPLMKAREHYAYGCQHDYFDHPDIIGWTREGDGEHANSGLAVLMTNASGGSKKMYVGKNFAGMKFYDCMGGRDEIVTIDADGNGEFFVDDGSVSVWLVKQLEIIEGDFSVCKVENITPGMLKEQFTFAARTDKEVSLVCRTGRVPKNALEREDGWRLFRFQGKLAFTETGVLSRITSVLAEEEHVIFAVSTFDTDYIMVKADKLEQAAEALRKSGYTI
jgi:alpha-amylase